MCQTKDQQNIDCIEWKVRWAEQQERKDSSSPVAKVPTYLMRVKSELKSTLVTGDNHRRKIRTLSSL